MAATQNIPITAAGGTVTLDVAFPLADEYILVPDAGTTTLVADFAITISAAPNQGVTFKVYFKPVVALNGHVFSIMGAVLTQIQLNLGGCYEFMFIDNAGSFVAFYTPADLTISNSLKGNCLVDGTVPLEKLVALASGKMILGSAGNVPTAVTPSGDATISNAGVITLGAKKVLTGNINDKAVQILQMDDLARGRLYVGDASNRPSAFDARTANNLLCGNAAGTDPVMAPVSGDLIMTAPGVFRLASTVGAIFRADLVIASAALLTANATPLDILVAQGVGRTINVIDAIVNQTFVTTAYTTNLKLEVYTDTATVAQKELTCLDFTTSRITKMKAVEIAAAANTQLIPNKGLKLRVASGDPAVGDGTIVLTVYFTILT